MRRRPGIQGLQHRAAEKANAQALGEDVAEKQLQHAQEQLAVFKTSLESFATKHREQIRRDPAFRAQFHQMCAHVGVDPLASNKGMWSQMLGLGDFYYELAVQVVEVCLLTRASTGGLLGMAELVAQVQQRRGGAVDAVSEDDVVRAIHKLKALGSGFAIITVGSKKVVRSVPTEVNEDHNALLHLADGVGCVSASGVRNQLGWHHDRVDAGLQDLLRAGMAMVDDGAPNGERLYWFPCVSATPVS